MKRFPPITEGYERTEFELLRAYGCGLNEARRIAYVRNLCEDAKVAGTLEELRATVVAMLEHCI